MPTLHIKNIHCIETEDNWGADHAYLYVNGEHIWGPKRINDDQWRDIKASVSFTEIAVIELYEKDDNDPDDYLGTWVARNNENGRGEIRAFFNADDCNYEMFYEVTD